MPQVAIAECAILKSYEAYLLGWCFHSLSGVARTRLTAVISPERAASPVQTLDCEASASPVSFILQVALAVYGLLWVPTPLGLDAPAAHFSEARALKHATYLSEDIGDRIVIRSSCCHLVPIQSHHIQYIQRHSIAWYH